MLGSKHNFNDNKDSYSMEILSSLYQSYYPISSAHYFKIKGKNTLGSFTGLVAVNEIMDKIYPEKKIDWEVVPDYYLHALFHRSVHKYCFLFRKSRCH